jgi:hypothetical protein
MDPRVKPEDDEEVVTSASRSGMGAWYLLPLRHPRAEPKAKTLGSMPCHRRANNAGKQMQLQVM